MGDGNDANKAAIEGAGGVRALVAMVRSNEARKARVEALYALGHFCHPESARTLLIRAKGIPALVACVDEAESQAVRSRARRMLLVVASGNNTEHHRLIEAFGGKHLVKSLVDELDAINQADAP